MAEEKDSGIIVPGHVKKTVDEDAKKEREETGKQLDKKLEGFNDRLTEIKEWALERGFIVREEVFHQIQIKARPMNPAERSQYDTIKDQLKQAQADAAKNKVPIPQRVPTPAPPPNPAVVPEKK